MNEKFQEQFDGLLQKYTELLLGESDEEYKQKVEKWALYSYIAKTMPALVKHWNETYPDAKEEMVKLITEIKKRNDEHRQNK
ncbi:MULTISPECIES: YusU family protein [Bacillus]|uniref:YusU family protein n=1 Tax=Bacillus yunxiaonensis TaxID=3127665 RepID=A0ABU8FWB3_9BACI